MKDRNEYDKLLHSLKEGAQQIEQDGVAIELRNCADRQPGQADPRSALASHLTREEFAAHRQRFLAEQGYGYDIIDAGDL